MQNKFSKNIELELDDFIYKNNSFYLKNTDNQGLVMIYAHWCGYCNILTPTWKKLHNKYKNKFTIKAIHVENKKGGNDKLVKQLNIQGYPTILKIEKDGKIGKKYEGERTIEEFVKFLD